MTIFENYLNYDTNEDSFNIDYQDSFNLMVESVFNHLKESYLDMTISFKLDQPINAIGSSGWDFLEGNILAGLNKDD